MGSEGKGKQKPGVLAFPAEIAPYKVLILPLDARVVPQYGDMLAQLRNDLALHGLPYKVDESGAGIGRRYARADELGIPFAITIDFDTLGRIRLPLCDIPSYIAKLS